MKMYKLKFNTMPIGTVGLAVLLDVLLNTTAFGATLGPIEFDASAKGETVGKVKINVETSGKNEGLKGNFEVTKKNEDGATMTVDELENFLGHDYLNWFQNITRDTNSFKDSKGNPLKAPYIDLPKDGYSNFWADDVPWYWHEKAQPAGNTRDWDAGFLLNNNLMGSALNFEDFPADEPGTEVDFATFLVGDFGDKTYQVLDGFSWKIKVGADGFTDIISLEKETKFTGMFAKQIQDEFGYKQVTEPLTVDVQLVPEPDSTFLTTLAFGAFLGTGLALKRQLKK